MPYKKIHIKPEMFGCKQEWISVLMSVYGPLLSGCKGQRKVCQTVKNLFKNWIKSMQGGAVSE